MYENAAGERFTFYCRKAPSPHSSLRYLASGVVGSYTWVEDDIAFVVSGPADQVKLKRVAEAVYEQIEARPQASSLAPGILSDARNVRR
jgi:hypothetical protein